jgi:hypothetical protein
MSCYVHLSHINRRFALYVRRHVTDADTKRLGIGGNFQNFLFSYARCLVIHYSDARLPHDDILEVKAAISVYMQIYACTQVYIYMYIYVASHSLVLFSRGFATRVVLHPQACQNL